MRTIALFLMLSCGAAASVTAQPALESLWPHENGRSFSYDGLYEDVVTAPAAFTGRLFFDGSGVMAPGVTVQNLVGQVDDLPAGVLAQVPDGLAPLLARLWVARPDLRTTIAARAVARSSAEWPALLLGPAEIADGVGHLQTETHIGLWRDEIADWSWWVLTDDLTNGASFSLQLVPDLAQDVFLHGTVRGFEESISTGAGSWTNAVVVDYVVELGTSLIGGLGDVAGTMTSEIRGWVAFVPGVGPVASSEDWVVVSVDCPLGCPEEEWEGQSIAHTELSLRSVPVTVEVRSWGAVKAEF